MPKTIFKIPTWNCDCGYNQDFDPDDSEMMSKVFRTGNVGDRKFNGIKDGNCARCHSNGKESKMERATEANGFKKSEVTIMGEEEVDDLIVWKGGSNKLVTMPRVKVDEVLESMREKHIAGENKNEFNKAIKEGRDPDYSKPKSEPELPEIRELTVAENKAMKDKIKADIVKWKALECKE